MAKLDTLLLRYSRTRTPGAHYENAISRGLIYVGTYATKNGYTVSILNYPHLTFPELKIKIIESGVQVIGFSIDFENVYATIDLINLLKNALPELKCVCGGIQASCTGWDERILNNSLCDIVVRGEGEITFKEVLDYHIKSKGTLDKVEGITYRTGNEIKRNPDRKFIKDLDILPFPDYSIVDSFDNDSHQILPSSIISARGCPKCCAFCYNAKHKIPYRTRSISNVISEIENVIESSSTHEHYLNIDDLNFIASPDRVLEFCRGIETLNHKHNKKVVWVCEGSADYISRNPYLIPVMAKAGLIRIMIGIESGDQRVLDGLNKGITLNEVRDAVRICSNAGIIITANFIFGGPFESRETIQNTLKFVEELIEISNGLLEARTGCFMPLPDTPISDNPSSYGITIFDPDLITGINYSFDGCFSRTENLTEWEILAAKKRFVDIVFNKLASIYQNFPHEIILKFFEMAIKWHEITVVYSGMRNLKFSFYYYSNFIGDYVYFKEIPETEIEEFKPVRTAEIEVDDIGKPVISGFSGNLNILDVGEAFVFVYSLCSGKLKVRDIINVTWQRYFQELSREDVKKRLISGFEYLDNIKLVVFTKL